MSTEIKTGEESANESEPSHFEDGAAEILEEESPPTEEEAEERDEGDGSQKSSQRVGGIFDSTHSLEQIFDPSGHLDEVDGEHWSVPWSDLMMVMFVLFAALLAAQALERKEIEPKEVPKEKQVPGPDKERPPNFEPLMRVNVFERSKQAVR